MIRAQDGVVRLDDAGAAAALARLKGPSVTLEVLVAGATLQLHRAAVDAERAVVLLAVRPGLHQLMELPPAHVAAALVRMTRTGPRRASSSERRTAPAEASTRLLSADDGVRRRALHEAAATLAWRLRVGWHGEHRDLVVVDGPDGLHVLDDEADELLPVSATSLYRVFTTALPPEALEPTS